MWGCLRLEHEVLVRGSVRKIVQGMLGSLSGVSWMQVCRGNCCFGSWVQSTFLEQRCQWRFDIERMNTS